MMRGQIALDIDGTVTHGSAHIAEEVVAFLHTLHRDRWFIHFVTGRTFFWAMHLLERLPFPFFVSAFNGAQVVSMPEGKVIFKKCLSKKHLDTIVSCLHERDIACVIYAEQEGVYKSFLHPAHASPVVLDHLHQRFQVLREEIVELPVLAEFPCQEFVALRCFGLPSSVREVGVEIEGKLGFSAPRMTDSYDPRFSVVQVTDKGVTKGSAIDTIFRHTRTKGKVIGCGDDHNDMAMFKKANVCVVMANAPPEVLEMADVIAPPAKEQGIIQGLQEALKKIDLLRN